MRYLVVLMLAGCAHQWTHPTKDQSSFHNDFMRCDTLSWQVVGSDGGYVRDAQRVGYRDNCMRAQGWQ